MGQGAPRWAPPPELEDETKPGGRVGENSRRAGEGTGCPGPTIALGPSTSPAPPPLFVPNPSPPSRPIALAPPCAALFPSSGLEAEIELKSEKVKRRPTRYPVRGIPWTVRGDSPVSFPRLLGEGESFPERRLHVWRGEAPSLCRRGGRGRARPKCPAGGRARE